MQTPGRNADEIRRNRLDRTKRRDRRLAWREDRARSRESLASRQARRQRQHQGSTQGNSHKAGRTSGVVEFRRRVLTLGLAARVLSRTRAAQTPRHWGFCSFCSFCRASRALQWTQSSRQAAKAADL